MSPNSPLFRPCAALLLAAGMLALGACDEESAEPSAEPRAAPLDAEDLADLDAAVCDPTHMVGRRTSGTGCPPVDSWVGKPVFEGPGTPDQLKKYCDYTWTGGTPPNVQALEQYFSGVGHVAPDCQAVQPQTDRITDEIGADLQALFHWNANRVDGAALAAAYPNASPAEISTAVVDTIPNTSPSDPTSDHGPIMASIVEAFACPSGTSCTVNVEPWLGLPRTSTGIDTVNGGVIGLQSDLARGIYRAVRDFEDSSAEHLVINLSVGWEPALFGGMVAGGPDRPSAQSVHAAILYARCHGALIIAAAGNANGFTCNEGALAPGRWEQAHAPGMGECAGVGVPSPILEPANYAPLVHSVGGLDGRLDPMPGSREFGMPRLAAPATHAVGSLPTDAHVVRTGTSVASAVASGAASLVWAHHPQLSASQVMATLYLTGRDIGEGTADYGESGTVKDVRGVNVCGAMKLACSHPNSECNAQAEPLVCNSAAPTTIKSMVDRVKAIATAPTDVPLEPVAKSCAQTCGAPSREVYAPPGETVVCEESERDPTLRLTNPQPPDPGIADAIIDVPVASPDEAHALVTISDYYVGVQLLSAQIEIKDLATEVVHVFPINEPEGFKNEEHLGGSRMSTEAIDGYTIPLALGNITDIGEPRIILNFEDHEPTDDPMILSHSE